MTVLADLVPGDAFLLLMRVAVKDLTGTGTQLEVYAADGSIAGMLSITPAGAVTGTLAVNTGKIPVTPAPNLSILAVGDIMARDHTGETMVVRWVEVQHDGTYLWGPSAQAQVAYTARGWTKVGHIDLTSPSVSV